MKPQKDRLSEMPDEVIVHILSYLPTVDAVRTMLIRPFGNLWTLIPTLNFNDDEVIYKMAPDGKLRSGESNDRRFHIFVHNVLMLHRKPVIDKFHLVLLWCHDRGSEVGDDIRMWLRFALDKQAKEIFFSDAGYVGYDGTSPLPNFTSQSLVTLELCYCTIYPQLQVNLGSLEKLIFYRTQMCEEVFEQFICGCPSLQELHIVQPDDIRTISFSAPNIRKLSLVLEEDEYSDDPWSLNFPNLQSLDLEIDRIPDVINVSSVRDVYIKKLLVHKDEENEIRKFNIFLEKFSRCEVFQLSLEASEPFSHSIDDLHLLQIRWKRVVLGLRIFCRSCLLGIYQLVRSSKHLEELTIYTARTLTYDGVCNTPVQASADLSPVELSYPCVLPKLKTVTLHGYAKPWKHQLQLIEFFLKSATVLEELVIVLNKRQSTAVEKLNFVMHVSTFQRSSPSARVFFL